MIKKSFLLGLALLVAGQFMVAQTFKMIVVKADGTDEAYAVSDVQKVVFDLENNTMTVNMKAGADVPNVTSLSFDETTGIESPKVESSIFVFPNPVKETLTVKGVEKDAIISLYDMSGKLLQAITSQENSTDINVSSLQQGIYLLQIDKQIIKFIKK